MAIFAVPSQGGPVVPIFGGEQGALPRLSKCARDGKIEGPGRRRGAPVAPTSELASGKLSCRAEEHDARAWAPGIVVDVVQLRPLVLVGAPDEQLVRRRGALEVGHGGVTLGKVGGICRAEAVASNGGHCPSAPSREALRNALP